MSQWRPGARREDDNEPTVVIDTNRIEAIRHDPATAPTEHTQIITVPAVSTLDLAKLNPLDSPAYAYHVERLRNRRLTDVGLLVLRLLTLPLVIRGLYQVAHFREGAQSQISWLMRAPEGATVAIGVAAVVLPILLAFGLFTRLAALLLAGLVAAVYALSLLSGAPILDAAGLAGEAQLAYGALALPLVFTGAGFISFDHRMGARKRERIVERRVIKAHAR